MQMTDATFQANHHSIRIRKTGDDARAREIEVRLDGGEWAESFEMDEVPTPEDFQLAVRVAIKVYGARRRTGDPACTNRLIHEIYDAMRTIAGC